MLERDGYCCWCEGPLAGDEQEVTYLGEQMHKCCAEAMARERVLEASQDRDYDPQA